MRKNPPGLNQRQWLERGLFVRGVAKTPDNRAGLVYGISYVENGRRKMVTVGPRISDARAALAARRGDMARRKFDLPSRQRPPRFPDFASRYLTEYSMPHKRSWQRDEWAIKKAVEFFGMIRLDHITAADIERYRSKRIEAGVSIATANRDVALLKSILTVAVRWSILPFSPAVGIKQLQEPEKPFRVLSREEETRLLGECAPHLVPLVIVALETGLRHGELVALEWRDVDLPHRELTVRRSKSGRIRTVPLTDRAWEALEGIEGREGSVFRFKGKAVRWVDHAFNRAVERSGIERLVFHDLRHTFITRLVRAGVSLPKIKKLAGHATITTTHRYAHVSDEDLREAVQRLDRAAPKPHLDQSDAPE